MTEGHGTPRCELDAAGSARAGFVSLFVTIVLVVAFAAYERGSGWLYGTALFDWNTVFFFPPLAFAWCIIVTARLTWRRCRRPLVVMRVLLRRNWWRVVLMWVLLLAIGWFSEAFTTLKQMIPTFEPFYLDPLLTRIDQAIFGTDPWRLTHALVGPYGTFLIDRLYVDVFFPVTSGLIFWIVLTNDHRFQVRALLTSVLMTFVLGFVMATLLSSSGPVFYHHDYGSAHFDELTNRLAAIDRRYPLHAVSIAKWLGTQPATFGGGISAMPSVHIGIAWLIYVLARHRFGWRHGLAWIALAFVGAIWFASVHLAWHYFTDGLVSIVVVELLWRLTGAYLDALGRSSAARRLRVRTPPLSKARAS